MISFTSTTMKRFPSAIVPVAVATAGLLGLRLTAQPSQADKAGAVSAHIEAARKAAGKEHTAIFEGICAQFAQRAGARPAPAAAKAKRADPPDRSTWHAEPMKVFDNLFFVGEKD